MLLQLPQLSYLSERPMEDDISPSAVESTVPRRATLACANVSDHETALDAMFGGRKLTALLYVVSKGKPHRPPAAMEAETRRRSAYVLRRERLGAS